MEVLTCQRFKVFVTRKTADPEDFVVYFIQNQKSRGHQTFELAEDQQMDVWVLTGSGQCLFQVFDLIFGKK